MPKRYRRRTKNILAGPRWSGVDTVMTIGALGVVGFIGYFMLKSGKGLGEALDSLGQAAKSTVDAGNKAGDWLGDMSWGLQKKHAEVDRREREFLSNTGEGLGNFGCHVQRGVGLLLSPLGVKPVDCRGAGGWRDNDDDEPSKIVRNIGNTAGKPSLDEMIENALKPRGSPLDAIGEGVGNKLCHAQKLFNPSLKCG